MLGKRGGASYLRCAGFKLGDKMADESYCTVQTAEGKVRGLWRDENGKMSAAFLGIPFAKAPVGELRFAAPAPVDPWAETLDVLEFGPTAERGEPDNSMIPENVIPGDATLNLDVFTPRPGDTGAGLPVLVWIHGGGYFGGSPASPWYDGRTYNREGIVTVTLHYRLGFDGFGWIEGAPANRGVLDWMAGLEWVQRNIRAFGGDPDRVTISGQSAGGGAVLTPLGMEQAQHLFSGVHSVSGALGDRPKEGAIEFARQLGEELGVAPTVEALREVSEDRIFEVQQKLDTPPGFEYLESMVKDGPLVAPVVDGELIKRPTFESYAMGIGSDKALMLGATDEEFLVLTMGMSDQLQQVPTESVMGQVGFTGDVEKEYVDAHKDYLERGNAALLGKYLSDGIFRNTVVRSANARGGKDTWVYRFKFVSGSYGLSAHCLDVPFWFDCLDSKDVALHTGENPPQALADAMHGASVAFITDKNPGWDSWADTPGEVKVFGGDNVAETSHGDYDDVKMLLDQPFRR